METRAEECTQPTAECAADTRQQTSRTVQTSWLALSNLLSLSVGIISSAILSRALAPAEYGTYRQVIYIYSTLLIVFSMGLPRAYAYFLARVPVEQGRDVVRRLHLLFTGLAGLFSALLLFGSRAIAAAMGNPMLAENLMLFAATPMLLMPVMGVESVLTVYGRARLVLLYVAISRSFTILCTTLPVLLVAPQAKYAVMGFVAAAAVTCATGLRLSRIPFRGIGQRPCNLTTGDFFRFAKPVFTASVYGFVIGSASRFFVSRYFGVEEFALFDNGYRELPFAGMIIGATATVLLPEFSRMAKEGATGEAFAELWRSTITKSAAVIYPLSIFCALFAEEIISLLYGNRYAPAAMLFRIVTLVNLTRIVPYAPILLALDKGSAFARAHLIAALLLVGLDAACVRWFPSLMAIAAITTGCTILCMGIALTVVVRALRCPPARLVPWRSMGRVLAAACTACTAAKTIVGMADTECMLLRLMLGAAVAVPLHLAIAQAIGVDYRTIVNPVVRRLRRQPNG